MTYTSEQSQDLCRNCETVANDLQTLMLDGLVSIRALSHDKVRQHMTHGVGRRLGAMRRALGKIFLLFPPSQTQPLGRETLEDVQIYLQAFVINLYGVFDNWAWSFVFRHDLLGQIGSRTNVSLFKDSTRQFLPDALRSYLVSDTIAAWHEDYLKGYRDALAHRIPIYIPPATWSEEDKGLYERLENRRRLAFRRASGSDWMKFWAEQDVIGKACPVFMHEYSEDVSARPVFLHPQLVCDGGAVVEFGKLFLANWQFRPRLAVHFLLPIYWTIVLPTCGGIEDGLWVLSFPFMRGENL